MCGWYQNEWMGRALGCSGPIFLIWKKRTGWPTKAKRLPGIQEGQRGTAGKQKTQSNVQMCNHRTVLLTAMVKRWPFGVNGQHHISIASRNLSLGKYRFFSLKCGYLIQSIDQTKQSHLWAIYDPPFPFVLRRWHRDFKFLTSLRLHDSSSLIPLSLASFLFKPSLSCFFIVCICLSGHQSPKWALGVCSNIFPLRFIDSHSMPCSQILSANICWTCTAQHGWLVWEDGFWDRQCSVLNARKILTVLTLLQQLISAAKSSF